MSELLVKIPRSSSKRLEEAVSLAKAFDGFREHPEGYEITPKTADIQTDSFQQLFDIIKNWKGAEFHEDGILQEPKHFNTIGRRVGDTITRRTPEDWIESNEWYAWERPRDVLYGGDGAVGHFLPKRVERVALLPVEVEVRLDPEAGQFHRLKAEVDGVFVGYVKESIASKVLARTPDFETMRLPAVLVKGSRLAECYLWPGRPLSNGVILADDQFDVEVDCRWWTNEPASHHKFALWTLKFPNKKEPFDRFFERIEAELEGRTLEPLPSSIKARERRQQKRLEAEAATHVHPRLCKQRCGSQAAALIALAWLFSLV